MKYVYILESDPPDHFYVGMTDDLRARLHKHNAGEVSHTSKFRPWRLKTYLAFSDERKTAEFERYLKSCVGEGLCEETIIDSSHRGATAGA